MSLDPWLRFAHIMAAMAWVGGGVVLAVLGARARRSADPQALAEFARTMATRVHGSWVGRGRTFVFGVWLVLRCWRSLSGTWFSSPGSRASSSVQEQVEEPLEVFLRVVLEGQVAPAARAGDQDLRAVAAGEVLLDAPQLWILRERTKAYFT